MSPDQIKVISAQHGEWLNHPITRIFIQFLENEEKKQVNLISVLSSDYTEFTSDRLRRYAMRLTTITTIKAAAHDSTILIAGSAKP